MDQWGGGLPYIYIPGNLFGYIIIGYFRIT